MLWILETLVPSALRPFLIKVGSKIFRSIRKIGLYRDELQMVFNVGRNLSPRIFNLDVHVSVVADLAEGLSEFGVKITNWSISGSNSVFRKVLVTPDPVEYINSKTWHKLDEEMIQGFRERYSNYLRGFDGFISTYPPAFSQIYEGLGKPCLTVIATRYEWPYSGNTSELGAFNNFLIENSKNRDFFLAANNRADRDYLEFYTGIQTAVVPSVCDYTSQRWDGKISRTLVVCRSQSLIEEIHARTLGKWEPARKVLGHHYKWSDLAHGTAFFIVPYNISTMTFFELASMGVPVIVPSPKLLKELRPNYEGVLSELSFDEMFGKSPLGLGDDDPNNWQSGGYLDWWLSRADYFDSDLMPNVAVIDSLDQLNSREELFSKHFNSYYKDLVYARNQSLLDSRRGLLKKFLAAA